METNGDRLTLKNKLTVIKQRGRDPRLIERQTNRQIDGEERHIETDTSTQIDTQTDRHKDKKTRGQIDT